MSLIAAITTGVATKLILAASQRGGKAILGLPPVDEALLTTHRQFAQVAETTPVLERIVGADSFLQLLEQIRSGKARGIDEAQMETMYGLFAGTGIDRTQAEGIVQAFMENIEAAVLQFDKRTVAQTAIVRTEFDAQTAVRDPVSISRRPSCRSRPGASVPGGGRESTPRPRQERRVQASPKAYFAGSVSTKARLSSTHS